MRVRNKIVYGIAGILAFMPLIFLVIIQSVVALKASYDSTLTIDNSQMNITEIIVYDSYNAVITDLLDVNDDNGKPVVFSIIEATDKYLIINLHGGKVEGDKIKISAIQFKLEDGSVTELLSGIVYLKFKNVQEYGWLQDFIEDMNTIYALYYEQPAGTISYLWVKIIMASAGTLLGLITVLLVVLRKSTKALVKRYWRIAVLVALAEGTIILGLIAWIATDMFLVFAMATLGWAIFLGTEKLAKVKGYLESPSEASTQLAITTDPVTLAMQNEVTAILNKYRK